MPTPTTTTGMNLRQLLERGERVFSSHPQTTRYFPATSIENARKRIKRTIDRSDGLGVIIGAAGMGKSLLMQVLAEQYHQRLDVVLLACARICTRRALLQTILFELGLSHQGRDEGQLRLSLLDHLLSAESGAGLLLLVDEAQSLSVPLLEEMRVMTNLVRGGVPRIRLVLAGLPALEEILTHPELESFSQRLSARCYLSAFNREETTQFVRAQVAASGGAPEKVLAADMTGAVFDATDGVPRLVNQLCDRAMLMAEAENQLLLDRQLIQAAWADLQQLPTAWNATHRPAVAAPASQFIEFGSLAETAPIVDELADVDPTELDADDEAPIVVLAVAPQRTVETKPPAKITAEVRRPVQRVAPTPGDPFAEEFDEEEVVLDSFAAWDDMFHRGTPRVENQRDGRMSGLVQAAINAQSSETREQPPAAELEFGVAGQIEPVDGDVADELADEDAPTTDRPRLRLAVVSDHTAPEPTHIIRVDATIAEIVDPVSRALSPTSVGNLAARTGFDSPILIIEDDGPSPHPPTPPVRRESYQHLFSRLRSG